MDKEIGLELRRLNNLTKRYLDNHTNKKIIEMCIRDSLSIVQLKITIKLSRPKFPIPFLWHSMIPPQI